MKLILAIPLLIATIIYSCQSYKIQGANEALVHIQPVADDLFHVRMKHAGNDYNLRLKRPGICQKTTYRSNKLATMYLFHNLYSRNFNFW